MTPTQNATRAGGGQAVLIRFASRADALAMKEIFNREVEQSTSSWAWFPLSNEDWQDWLYEHTRDDHVLLVAEVDGQVVGFAGYGSFRTKDAYVTTVEDSVFLKDGYRGLGLGKALLARLLDEARTRSVHAMVAAVTGENQASIRLHRSLGFAEVGHLPEVGHKFGRWLDLVLLQIVLDDQPGPGPVRID